MCCKFAISALCSSSSRWPPWTCSNFLFCWSLESKKERDIAQEAHKQQHIRLSSYRQFSELFRRLACCAWYRVSGRCSNGSCKTVYPKNVSIRQHISCSTRSPRQCQGAVFQHKVHSSTNIVIATELHLD